MCGDIYAYKTRIKCKSTFKPFQYKCTQVPLFAKFLYPPYFDLYSSKDSKIDCMHCPILKEEKCNLNARHICEA